MKKPPKIQTFSKIVRKKSDNLKKLFFFLSKNQTYIGIYISQDPEPLRLDGSLLKSVVLKLQY